MKTQTPLRLTALYAFPFLLINTVLFLIVLVLQEHYISAEEKLELRTAANTLVQEIIITRRWNAGHGGVYVPVTFSTRPNPYLDDPERDIVSRTGKRYTKMNPAYMTRELGAIARESRGLSFRLTSDRPLNPANRPDDWEALALRDFKNGAMERMATVTRDDGRWYRFIVPLTTEASCLTCHARQGYRLGDIRGAISVSIPMKDSDLLFRQRIGSIRILSAALWLSISAFIVLVSYTLSRKITFEIQQGLEVNQLKTAVQMAGAASHEIRQPLTVIVTYADILRRSKTDDANFNRHVDNIVAQCIRIDEILQKMSKITHYRTKPYIGTSEITDFSGEGKQKEHPGSNDEKG